MRTSNERTLFAPIYSAVAPRVAPSIVITCLGISSRTKKVRVVCVELIPPYLLLFRDLTNTTYPLGP
jgi:hypothetical protein